jgi:hypothetical protein
MRIRSVFLLSVALGSAVGVAAALLFALQQWSDFEAARHARHDTVLLASALRLPKTMNMERAFINARLVASTIATPQLLAPILRQTALVDTTLSNTRDLSLIPAAIVALQALQDRLLNVREAALAMQCHSGRGART